MLRETGVNVTLSPAKIGETILEVSLAWVMCIMTLYVVFISRQ